MSRKPIGCRVFGHRWHFSVEGDEVAWDCTRCGTAGGRRGYADEREARRYARAFNDRAPKPPTTFLAVFGGLMPGRDRSKRR